MKLPKPRNQQEVKTNLESIRKSDNPQPVIKIGDEVRVMVKKKFDKSYVPNWTDKTYKVTKKQEWNHVYLQMTLLMTLKQCMGSATHTMIYPATRIASCGMSCYG